MEISSPFIGDMPTLASGRQVSVTLKSYDLRSVDNLEFIGKWDALAEWAAEPNPFFESWFLLPSMRALDPHGKVRLLCMEIDGQLAGLMPISLNRRYYGRPIPHLSNWAHPNCLLGSPLIVSGAEAIFWREILNWADAQGGSAIFLHLMQMPLSGPVNEALARELADFSHRPSGIVMREERAVLRSDLSATEYVLETCSSKKRKMLRRSLSQLQDAGDLRFQWYWDDANIDQWADDFLQLEASGWKGEAGSALNCAKETRSLFTASIKQAASKGKLIRLSMTLDQRPIAMLCNFLSSRVAFGFKTAFDEAYRDFSPGVLLEHEYLNTQDNSDISWHDSCASQGHSVMDALWTARRPIGAISIGIGGVVRRATFNQLLKQERKGQRS